ncbi:MAG: helix-turn-helix domain-containing protein [Treponema sp.]|jgi:YesN/AraC family two-component response regulator|nr:helix-turn-helix domain-containing protein [Treponema sp.]
MKHNYSKPGYSRERKIVSIYTRATGSNVQIYNSGFQLIKADADPGIEQSVCQYCKHYMNCREVHVNVIQKSGRRGKPHIYQCELGLVFWSSPIYNEGNFSGALRGSGYINDSVDRSTFAEKCNGTISPDEFTRRLSAFPSCDMGKIRSFAEMLLLCTESLSIGNENYHEIFRLRSEQQAALSVLIEKLRKKYPEGSALPGYPLDKECQLITSLHRGDKEESEKLLNEILAMLIFSNPNNFRYIQLRVLELAVLITRTGVNPSSASAMESNVRCLRQIQEAKTVEELAATLHGIVENIAAQIASFQGIPHALAMRKAETYIRENLTRKISLNEISKVAGLSAPYFSTIFKEEMGENFSRYINRLRVEKASKMILETNLSLSEISAACCFEDQSWFSKIFKAFTGISPGKYRNQGGRALNV